MYMIGKQLKHTACECSNVENAQRRDMTQITNTTQREGIFASKQRKQWAAGDADAAGPAAAPAAAVVP